MKKTRVATGAMDSANTNENIEHEEEMVMKKTGEKDCAILHDVCCDIL